MIHNVQVPVAMLLIIPIDADTPELAQEAAKAMVKEDLDQALEEATAVQADPFDNVLGKDGDPDSDDTSEVASYQIAVTE